MGVVFTKTVKGHQEMECRTGQLGPKVRRVLIMVDGRKTVEQLRAVLASDDLSHTLGMLEEDGFIEVLGTREEHSATIQPFQGQTLPPITAFRPLVSVSADSNNFSKARNFMLNTLNFFVGSLGSSSLQSRIEDSKNHLELRDLFHEWYHAIVSSREGRREAESLRSKLLEIL